jgi:CheY-like chemotaxis protein
VKNGEEALQSFTEAFNNQQKFDTLIFDLTIQDGMGGKEAIKTIREIDKNVIAFVCTGYSEDPVIADPTAFGFNDSISKPFSAEELTEKLQNYLS